MYVSIIGNLDPPMLTFAVSGARLAKNRPCSISNKMLSLSRENMSGMSQKTGQTALLLMICC